MSKAPAVERRRTKRRPVLESFSLFVVIPRKGDHRLPVYDVSDHGLKFDLDTEGEPIVESDLREGETLDVHFYLNHSLYLPLAVRLMRIERLDSVRRVGAEIVDRTSRSYDSYLAFLKMLDSILDEARFQS